MKAIAWAKRQRRYICVRCWAAATPLGETVF